MQGSVLGPVHLQLLLHGQNTCSCPLCATHAGQQCRSALGLGWLAAPRCTSSHLVPCFAGEDSSVLGRLTSAALAPSLKASAGQLVAVESAASVTGQLGVPEDGEAPLEAEASGDAAADSAAAGAAAAAAEAVDLTRQALACAAAAAAAREGRAPEDGDAEPQEDAAAEVQLSSSSSADNACSQEDCITDTAVDGCSHTSNCAGSRAGGCSMK